MKKLVALLTMVLCLSIVGCGEKKEYIDGFEKADCKKYGSENPSDKLIGNKICVEGEMNYIDASGFYGGANGIRYVTCELFTDDGNKWIVVAPWPGADYPEEIRKLAQSNGVARAFGQYAGYSDIGDAPAIALLPLEDEWYEYSGIPKNNEKKYADVAKEIRVEKKDGESYDTVWSFFEIGEEIVKCKNGKQFYTSNYYHDSEEGGFWNFQKDLGEDGYISAHGQFDSKEIATIMFVYYIGKFEDLGIENFFIDSTLNISDGDSERNYLYAWYQGDTDEISGLNIDGSWSDGLPDWMDEDSAKNMPEEELDDLYEKLEGAYDSFLKEMNEKPYELFLKYTYPGNEKEQE